MKTNRKAIEVKPQVNVSLKILPFGSIHYEIRNTESPIEEKEHDMPRYIEPKTTNVEKIEIRYGEGDTYLVPKTTAGV